MRRTAQSVLLVVLAGCGGDNTGPGGGGNAAFSATIDGTPWTASAASTHAGGSANGTFTITGAESGANPTALGITVFNIAGPGTYPLGVGGSVVGGTAAVTSGASAFLTPLSGSAGTVTISAVSATHITGTFAFTAGVAPSTRVVTGGSFDLPVVSTGSVTVPPYAGSRFTGTLGGAPWNAATVVVASPPSSGTLGAAVSNNAYQITMFVSGWTGVGTYALGTDAARYFSVTSTSGALQSWGSQATATGTVTVTSASASRVAGSFDATLGPVVGGGGNLQLTGTFDFGI